MAPRTYTQDRRAASALATRSRILRAASDLYVELGVGPTTIRAVADRADVARGTVLHHFGSPEGLLDAVLDDVVGMIDMPDARVLDGLTTPEARVRRFVATMFDFYERSSSWWTVFGSAMEMPTLKAREQAFWEDIGRFQAAAFGPLAEDRLMAAAIGGFMHPATLGTMRSAGASLEDVTNVVAGALLDLARRREVAMRRG